jgi:hypothetical protein
MKKKTEQKGTEKGFEWEDTPECEDKALEMLANGDTSGVAAMNKLRRRTKAA